MADKNLKQAGAELDQAQDQLGLTAEAELVLTVENPNILISSYLNHIPLRSSFMLSKLIGATLE
jgi:hypothetical protein